MLNPYFHCVEVSGLKEMFVSASDNVSRKLQASYSFFSGFVSNRIRERSMSFSGLSPVICINAKETNWPYANKNDSIKVLSLQTNTSGAQNNTRLIIYCYGIIVLLYVSKEHNVFRCFTCG